MAYRPEQVPVYTAMRQFVERYLLGSQSLLWPDRAAWTTSNVAEIKRRVVDTPMLGNGSYEDKLLQQMDGASSEQWAVLCDTFYLYYLPSSSITLALKRERLKWMWTQGRLPAPPESVWEAQTHGFTRTSQRYNLKYAQTWLILLFAHFVKQHSAAAALLQDPRQLQAALDDILEAIPARVDRATDMRHALLHMLFPEHYERSTSTGDKDAIIRAYGARVGGPLPEDRDQALRAIREALRPQYSTGQAEFDFYEQPLRAEWRGGPPPPTPATVTPPAQPPPEPVPAEDLGPVLAVLEHTRNVILYGPPGTGKTYLARRVAEALVEPQLREALPEAARIQRVAAELPFYEIVALALYQAGRERPLRVNDILDAPLVQARLQASPVKYPRESIWNNLQSHTSPDSATVKVTRRFEPYLFDKDDESRWRLTADGRAYVESNLADSLRELREPGAPTTTPADYVVWTTFHQSYSYEDFVEGIRPKADESGELSYPVVPGPLLELAKRAATQTDKKFVLVIDEINRGNTARTHFKTCRAALVDLRAWHGENYLTSNGPWWRSNCRKQSRSRKADGHGCRIGSVSKASCGSCGRAPRGASSPGSMAARARSGAGCAPGKKPGCFSISGGRFWPS